MARASEIVPNLEALLAEDHRNWAGDLGSDAAWAEWKAVREVLREASRLAGVVKRLRAEGRGTLLVELRLVDAVEALASRRPSRPSRGAKHG